MREEELEASEESYENDISFDLGEQEDLILDEEDLDYIEEEDYDRED